MAWVLRKNLATVSTNTGHTTTNGNQTWLFDPQKTIDWAHRALHFAVEAAKEVVATHYAVGLSYSYYAGCFTGGRQGLDALQRYPSDFDGVLVGSAIPWQTHTSAWQTYVSLLQYPSSSPSYIPASMWPTIADAVMAQCDAIDGLSDGVFMDPSKCAFDPEVLLCGKSTASPTACLTAPQIANLKRMYLPSLTSDSELINPGISPSGEASFALLMNSAEPLFGPQFYRYSVYNSSTWDWSHMSYADVLLARSVNPGGANAYDPDLRPFQSRGGKVMQYHGYAVPLIPSLNAPAWYDKVTEFYDRLGGLSAEVDDFCRLFMVPGMRHCSGGAGAWVLDAVSQGGVLPPKPGKEHSMIESLVEWVEGKSSAPEYVVGTNYVGGTPAGGVQFTRPACRWPSVAEYDGKGNVNDTTSWTCPTTGVY